MEILSGTLWYASWPLIIYVSVKFIELNVRHYKQMEPLEELEEYYAKNEAEKRKADFALEATDKIIRTVL